MLAAERKMDLRGLEERRQLLRRDDEDLCNGFRKAMEGQIVVKMKKREQPG